MVNWKSKYLKYKLKFEKLNAKNNLKGGMNIYNMLNNQPHLQEIIRNYVPVTIFVDGVQYEVPRDELLTLDTLSRLTGKYPMIFEIEMEDMQRYYRHQLMTPEELALDAQIYGEKYVGFQDYPVDGLHLSTRWAQGFYIRGEESDNPGRSMAAVENILSYGISN